MEFSLNSTEATVLAVAIVAATSIVISKFLGGKNSKKSGSKVALNPDEKIPFRLIDKLELSHDTRRFRFALQSPEHTLGLPIGKHMSLSATIDNNLVVRPYTPVSSDDDKGYFDLVVKVYFANTNPKFPEGGKMSQHLNNMRIGDSIDVRGPQGRITYYGNGVLGIREKKSEPEVQRKAKRFGLIAGGTGITPMLQVIKAVLKKRDDNTELFLLFANQTEDDILVRDMLEDYASKFPKQFHLWYTLDRPPASGWKYSSGFINDEMLKAHLPSASPDTQILMCGPPPMINFACIPNLEKLGFSKENYLAF